MHLWDGFLGALVAALISSALTGFIAVRQMRQQFRRFQHDDARIAAQHSEKEREELIRAIDPLIKDFGHPALSCLCGRSETLRTF
jgi:hypothetical protein